MQCGANEGRKVRLRRWSWRRSDWKLAALGGVRTSRVRTSIRACYAEPISYQRTQRGPHTTRRKAVKYETKSLSRNSSHTLPHPEPTWPNRAGGTVGRSTKSPDAQNGLKIHSTFASSAVHASLTHAPCRVLIPHPTPLGRLSTKRSPVRTPRDCRRTHFLQIWLVSSPTPYY